MRRLTGQQGEGINPNFSYSEAAMERWPLFLSRPADIDLTGVNG